MHVLGPFEEPSESFIIGLCAPVDRTEFAVLRKTEDLSADDQFVNLVSAFIIKLFDKIFLGDLCLLIKLADLMNERLVAAVIREPVKDCCRSTGSKC